MYVGVIFYQFKKENIKDAVKNWEYLVLNEAKRQQGFIKAEIYVNEETGEGLDIGFWETKEDAQRFQDTGLFDLLARDLKDHLRKPPRREQFEVVSSL
ncbi:MAG: hypothetical protein JW939_05675 [Candidatus Thermoplasmatota archaeon]|nr:hypothetical protein [Candidatus Thermoplasmatota archaeon]